MSCERTHPISLSRVQNNNNDDNNKARQVCVACLCDLLLKPSGRHVDAWRPRPRCSVEAPSAPSSDALAARAPHAANALAEHPNPQAAGTEYFSSLDVEDVPAAGSRRDRLFAVSGPQDWVQRRTVQQIVDIVPLPILDDRAPQDGGTAA